MPSPTFKASLQKGWNETVCRELIKQGSKSFYAASLILPQRVRKPAYALYAFCRLSDDAVDAVDAPRDAVDRLRERLDLAYDQTPMAIPADHAFADMVAKYQMPRALPLALLEGLQWDSEGKRFESLSDLYAYSARVAGSVGAMMTVLMGKRDEETLARACDLGVAMQLTNIARDVGEDARNGRVYIPLEWLGEAGVDVDIFLADPRFDKRIAGCVRKLLDAADVLYDRSMGGIAHLPADCRPAIHGARMIYREIGRKLAAQGLNSIDDRAYVPSSRKLALLAAANAAALRTRVSPALPPLRETAFLVDAVPPFDHSLHGDGTIPETQATGRFIQILEQLERRSNTNGHAGARAPARPDGP